MILEKIDLLIKNGHILDPAAGVDQIGCIGIHSGRSIGLTAEDTPAKTVVDASGCYVFPGLVDFHTHIFYRGSSLCVSPDCLIPMGVTTAADAGSAGCSNFRSFYSDIVAHSLVRIRTYLNVCSYGQPGDNFAEDFDPAKFCEEKIINLVRSYPHQIRGLKIRMGAEVLYGQGLEPLRRAKELAVRCGLPIVVHASNPPSSEGELLSILDRGDVLCHCYHGKGENTILDKSGHVYDAVRAARERGIIFDCANGITNYNHTVAQKAIADGFLPDIISTDLCEAICNRDGYGKSLPYVMAKYLWLGMSMTDVVRAATAVPARELGLEGRAGTLSAGAYGDAVICRHIEASPVFLDNFGEARTGDQMLVPMMTVKNGEILYRQSDF